MKYASVVLLLAVAACDRAPAPPASSGPGSLTGEAVPPVSISGGDYKILGPFAHENLSVFLLEKPGAPKGDENYLTLEEGLKSGAVRVTERAEGAQVNQLEVENAGDRPVYIQAGDTVKGGKQDRTIAIDFVLPPKSGKRTVDAFCVEPGRWAERGPQVQTAAVAFSPTGLSVATKEQKLALKGSKSQAEVWEAGRETNAGLARNAQTFMVQDSFVLAAEDPKVKEKTEAYVKALAAAVEGKDDLVGMAFAVNGEANTVEIYATTALFRKLWPKLLRGAAVEAFAKKPEKPVEKTAAAADILALLNEGGQGEGHAQALSNEIRMKSYVGKTVSLFDTEKDGALFHRQVIKR